MLGKERQMTLLLKDCPSRTNPVECGVYSTFNCCDVLPHLDRNYLPAQVIAVADISSPAMAMIHSLSATLYMMVRCQRSQVKASFVTHARLSATIPSVLP